MIILPCFRARKRSIQNVVPQMRLNAVAFHTHAKHQLRELSQPVDTQSQRQNRLRLWPKGILVPVAPFSSAFVLVAIVCLFLLVAGEGLR